MLRFFTHKKEKTAHNSSSSSNTQQLQDTQLAVPASSSSSSNNALLAAPRTPTKRKSSFFLAKVKTTAATPERRPELRTSTLSATSGSETSGSSLPLTPSDDGTACPAEKHAHHAHGWSSWMSSTSSKSKKQQDSIFASSSFSRSRTLLNADDNSEDDEDDSVADEHGRRRSTTVKRATSLLAPPPLSREASRALQHIQTLTANSLSTSSAVPPPLVHNPSSPLFPRSSNRLFHFPAAPSFHDELLKKRLLRRAERRSPPLGAAEQRSILPFASKSRPPPPRHMAAQRRNTEETYAETKGIGGGWSKGMKKWALRPCFEERVMVWIPTTGNEGDRHTVVATPVHRSRNSAVAELEFSEAAEALAGLHRQNELPPPPSDIYAPAANRTLPPPLVVPRSQNLHHAVPGSHTGLRSLTYQTSTAVARAPPARLSVIGGQFTEEEDDLPLGVVLLQKRQREEKEREELDRKRKAVEERERKAREERKFAEIVAAARERRETGGHRRDYWAEGVADAAPPPRTPTGSTRGKSSPSGDSRRQTMVETPSTPWNGVDFTAAMSMPLSAPSTQLTYPPTLAMLSTDPYAMAMFDQGFMPPWMAGSATGSPRSSSGSMTPPRLPGTGSRPSSFHSSSEDVRQYMSDSPQGRSRSASRVQERPHTGGPAAPGAYARSSSAGRNVGGTASPQRPGSQHGPSSHPRQHSYHGSGDAASIKSNKTLPRNFRSDTAPPPPLPRPSSSSSFKGVPTAPHHRTSSAHSQSQGQNQNRLTMRPSHSSESVNRTSGFYEYGLRVPPPLPHSHSANSISRRSVLLG